MKEKFLCFDSHYKTDLYLKVLGESLSAFVFVNRHYVSNNIEVGVDIPTLDISDRTFFEQGRDLGVLGLARVRRWSFCFDARYGMSLENLINLDRRLVDLDRSLVLRYLYFVDYELNHFLDTIPEVTHVLLEPTWAHEVLACLIFAKRSITVVQLKRCKLRPLQFYAFVGPFDVDYIGNPKSSSLEQLAIKEESSSSIRFYERDSGRNQSISRGFGAFIRLFKQYFHGEFNFFIHANFFDVILQKLFCYLRSAVIRSSPVKKMLFSAVPTNTNYVYFPLHFEPEASVLVSGREYRDQLSTIDLLRTSLPSEFTLVVKEHPHCIGNRSINFYRTVAALAGVVLVDPDVSSRGLIKGSKGVIAIAGTAVLEAYLMSKPGFTLAPMYFSTIWPHSDGSLKEQIDAMLSLNGVFYPSQADINDVSWGGFSGTVEDPKLDTISLTGPNIQLVREALAVVGSLK